MNMEFKRKLPIPKDIKEMFPIGEEYALKREEKIKEIEDILNGSSNKFMLVIGPCSADNESAVLDYLSRLRLVQDKVSDKICIIPRVYTNKPRTTGAGYKGMLHQPDPSSNEDMLKGIIKIREIFIKAMEETEFFCSDEMLYPENHRYLSDILCYVAVGARSVEDQQHRLTASGLDIPVGMKNPTGGDFGVLMNSITAAQSSHTFIYRNWEVVSKGNPYAHAVLRGH
ncbi:MAG: 3-deoxy-7-phosphoheptulonate synthase, partial [Firmicutes bacterium]|nr:3-deoxy-7-phosphoheptulonate synthase [Bacillota bacterium]